MKTILTSLGLSLLFLSGCGNNDATQVNIQAPYSANTFVTFDAQGGDIPYPNNILFADSNDTTLNIPYDPNSSAAAVTQALNTLDGFSTTSPITVGFSGEVNASTLATGLKLYTINATDGTGSHGIPVISGITGELTFGVDFYATVSGDKIVILPLKPLASSQNYMVVLTKDIKDNSGLAIAPDVATKLLLQEEPLVDENGNQTTLSLEDALKLEGIRQLTQAMTGYLVAQEGFVKENIVDVWCFRTQTIGHVAQAFFDANTTGVMGLQDTHLTSKDILALSGYDVTGLQANAEVYEGNLSQVPYYLAKANTPQDTAPLTHSFEFNTTTTAMPELNATLTIPVLVTIPKSTADKNITMPPNGWPVVIFQHGITQDRTNLLAIAEAFSSVGYAAVAIDLPLHGITNPLNPLYQKENERTFNLDLINNQTQESTPDEKIDPSGQHYINLVSLLTSRDNLRQTTADLIALKNSFGTIVAQDGTKFDPTQVAFVGHSLGTMAPFGFFAHADLESVTLAMPGGGIAELLNNSATFGPIVEAGLAAKGVIKGTAEYSAFMLATQTILDDADPLNYALEVGNKNKIFAIEVVGGNGNLSDQVIPNNVATAPLAGTDPLLKLLHATTMQGVTGDYITPNTVARYNLGDHSSFLDPSASYDATASMQRQTAGFVVTKGSFIPLVDDTLLDMNY